MNEISIILRNRLITIEEFRILDQYSYAGRIWTLIEKSTNSLIIKENRIEYIFDQESLIIFYIVSNNILAHWDTDATRNFLPNQEYHLKDSLFIRPIS